MKYAILSVLLALAVGAYGGYSLHPDVVQPNALVFTAGGAAVAALNPDGTLVLHGDTECADVVKLTVSEIAKLQKALADVGPVAP